MVQCPKGTKPRLFLTVCVSSIFVGIVSSLFLYFPYPTQQQVKGVTDPSISENLDSLADIKSPQHIGIEERLVKTAGTDSGISDPENIGILNTDGLNDDGVLIDKIRHINHHTYSQKENWKLGLGESGNFSSVINNRFIHFDLKGAPPNLFYIKEARNQN